jgi:hypothetical protein
LARAELVDGADCARNRMKLAISWHIWEELQIVPSFR